MNAYDFLRSAGWTQSTGELFGAWAVWSRGFDHITVCTHARSNSFRATLEKAGRDYTWADAETPADALEALVTSQAFKDYNRMRN